MADDSVIASFYIAAGEVMILQVFQGDYFVQYAAVANIDELRVSSKILARNGESDIALRDSKRLPAWIILA